MCRKCAWFQRKEDAMSRKVGQIIARGERRWLVRVYVGRDHESRKRKYHNRTIHGSLREAQSYLIRKLHERDLSRGVEGVQVTLDEFLNHWLATAAKPKLRKKSFRDYEGMLARYIRPMLGREILADLSTLDIQTTYQEMLARNLSARTIRYAHAIFRSALRQAVCWQLLARDPSVGVQLPRQSRHEIRIWNTEQAREFLRAALQTEYGCVLALALTTGMRPSEYLAP